MAQSIRIQPYSIEFPLLLSIQEQKPGRVTVSAARIHQVAQALLDAREDVALGMITGWRIDYGHGEVTVTAAVPEGQDPAALQRGIIEAAQKAHDRRCRWAYPKQEGLGTVDVKITQAGGKCYSCDKTGGHEAGCAQA